MPIGPTSGFLDFTNATPRADVIIALSNVGVGTDVPLHALDIRGTANVADIIINNDLTLTGGLTTNTLTINNVSMSTTSNFQQVTNVANDTTNTVRFTNPTTGFTVSSNAEVGGELSVSGNTVVSSNLTVSGNVGIGTTEPTESLDIVGNLNLQKVSNATSIKLNSNVVTEYTRSKKLIKYPRVAMTAATTGGYTASASDYEPNYEPWEAFSTVNTNADCWVTDFTENRYDVSTGLATTNAALFEGERGDWLQIQMPQPAIKLEYVIIHPRKVASNKTPEASPGAGRIFGSNDGSTWYLLTLFSGRNYGGDSSNENATSEVVQVSASVYYTYYRLQVTERAGQSGNDKYAAVGELELYGIPEYDPEAHGTDVIMRSVPNVPNTDWLEVYYDGQDYTSMPSTATDKSGNSVTGTPTNVTFDSEYKAFTFDGTGDIRSTVSTFSGDQPHTMSTWVYISSALNTADAYICVLAPSTGENLDQVSTIRFQNDGFNVQSWGNDIQMYNLGIQKERWYHLTVVYDGGGVTTTSKRLYINGVQNLSISGYTASGNTINFTNTTLSLGSRVDGSGSHLKGSIANFRLFNRALTGDEIWQLYAYQKDYFQVSPDVVTFKGGRLGVGTSEPRAPLDVMGIPYGPGARPVFFATNDSTSALNITAAGIFTDDLPDAHINVGGCYDGTTGRFTAKIAGTYMFTFHVIVVTDKNNRNFCQTTFYLNGTNVNRATTGRGLGYLIHQAVEHTDGEILPVHINRALYLNVGDYVQVGIQSITYAGVTTGRNYAWFTGYLLS